MKKLVIFGFLLVAAAAFFYGEQEQYNCFSIIAGRLVTEGGSVLIAHNEDDAGRNFVDVHKVPAKRHPQGEMIQLKNGAALPQIERTFGFLWLQIPGMEFGDTYMNENGVVIVSDQCRSREDNPELTAGGIGFMLRRIVAERAKSARHGVQVAGKLVDRFGYYSTGRTYCIADAKEGWFLHIVKGKHWLAHRVPDDRVAVIANYYTIGKIDPADKKNFMGSPDIVSYAIERGWYDPKRDGAFDFARAYSDPKTLKSRGNILRQWRATNLLAKKEYRVDDRFPFSFVPKRKVKTADLFRVLRDHFEGTEYDFTDHYRKGSPNSTRINNRAICHETTQYALVADLRSDLPAEIAHLVWIAFRRPDTNAFSPWYLSIDSPPSGYTSGDPVTALESHFKKPPAFFTFNAGYAFWNFARLSRMVDQEYRTRIKVVRKEWKNFETYLIKSQRKKEKEFLYLLERDKNVAVKLITNYVHELEYRKWFLTLELIDRIEKESIR